jgi:hypothetical protein
VSINGIATLNDDVRQSMIASKKATVEAEIKKKAEVEA